MFMAAGAEDGGSGLDGVVNRMKDLAVNRGDAMRRSKRDRASLKSSFRGYYKAVEVTHFSLACGTSCAKHCPLCTKQLFFPV